MFLVKRQLLIGLFFIPLFSYGQEAFLSVCDRTPQVREAIMEKIAQMDPSIECNDDDLMILLFHEFETLSIDSSLFDFFSHPILKADDFSGLLNLRSIDLSDNNIEILPPNLFSHNPNLQRIDLSDNQITLLPEELLSHLSDLRILKLSDNNIESIPPNFFSHTPNLQAIDLSDNQIPFIPEGFCSRLLDLRILHLADNNLETLPKNFCSNSSLLYELYLNGNNIITLPQIFFTFPRMQYLRVSGNPLGEKTYNRFPIHYKRAISRSKDF